VPLDWTCEGSVLPQRNVRPHLIVIGGISVRGEARPAETKLAPSTKAASRASGSASVPSSSCFRTGKDPWIAGGRSELSCGCNMLEYAAAERRETFGCSAEHPWDTP